MISITTAVAVKNRQNMQTSALNQITIRTGQDSRFGIHSYIISVKCCTKSGPPSELWTTIKDNLAILLERSISLSAPSYILFAF